MYSRKLALVQARQYRTCPPPGIADDSSQKEYFIKHLSICPYCSSDDYKTLKDWGELVEKFKQTLLSSKSSADPTKVAAGQLRFVRPELGGWVDAQFYNPSCVLILNQPGEISDDIQVAQVYHDISLAGPGDLILEKNHTGMFDLFVECWNTYTLKSEYLGPAVGCVSPKIVETVVMMAQNPEAVPDWAVVPMPLKDQDVRIYFRELEVEVGYVFASRSAAELMAELEGAQLGLEYSSPQETIDAIKNKNPEVYWPDDPATIEAVLATVQFPPEKYAMAAADDRRRIVPVNFIRLQHGLVESIEPLQGEIIQTEITSEGLTVGGHIIDAPQGLSGSILLCFLHSEREGLLLPFSSGWDEEKKLFLAKFDTRQKETAQLKIALVIQTDSE